MRSIIVSCISFLIMGTVSAQHAQITMSDDFKIQEKEYTNQTVAHSVFLGNSFYTATNSGIGGNYKWAFTKLYDMEYVVTVSKYDRNMQLIKKVELENGDRSFGPLMPKLFLANNRLFLAYYKHSNKSSFDFYLGLVDEETLELKSPKKICTIEQENVGIFKLESVINANQVMFANSPDKTKTLVACLISQNLIKTFIVDNDMNILKHADLRTSADDMNIWSAVLTNDDVSCLVLHSSKATKVVWASPEGRKSEFAINPVGNQIPAETDISAARDGKSIYVYTTTSFLDESEGGCNGMLLSQLDCSTLRMSRPISFQFSPEVIQTICDNGGGTKRKKVYSMRTFTPDLMELDNGDLVILGSPDDFSTSVTTSAPNMNGQTHEIAFSTYTSGPVLAFYLNKTAKTFDYISIPRSISITRSAGSGSGAIQIVQAPGVSRSYASFSAVQMGNEILIIYNETEKNITRAEGSKMASSNSTNDLVLAEALFSSDRKLTYRKQIGENLSKQYTYYLGNTVPNATNALIFPIARQGTGFKAMKTIYTNWCFLEVKQ